MRFPYKMLYYKPVSNHFAQEGGEGGLKSVIGGLRKARRKTLKTFVPITSKNSASAAEQQGIFLFINKMKKEKIGGEKSKVIRNGVRTQSDMQQYWTKEK